MSRKIMEQALSAFEAIMFEKDAESCQIIAKNARYGLREELAKPTNEFHPDWDTLKPYHDRIAELEAQLALDKKADNARELGLDYEPERMSNQVWMTKDEIAKMYDSQPEPDHGFDRTASHMAGEYVDTAQSKAMHEACIEASMRNAQPEQPDLRKAAQMALEALNQATGMCAERTSTRKDVDEAIEALRQALAQPEQEPVAYMHTCGSDIQINTLPAHCYGNNWTRTPLYTAPQKPDVTLTDEGKTEQGCAECGKKESDGWALYCVDCLLPAKREWVGLTDDEMLVELKNTDTSTVRLPPGFKYFARAIEAKLREKNG